MTRTTGTSSRGWPKLPLRSTDGEKAQVRVQYQPGRPPPKGLVVAQWVPLLSSKLQVLSVFNRRACHLAAAPSEVLPMPSTLVLSMRTYSSEPTLPTATLQGQPIATWQERQHFSHHGALLPTPARTQATRAQANDLPRRLFTAGHAPLVAGTRAGEHPPGSHFWGVGQSSRGREGRAQAKRVELQGSLELSQKKHPQGTTGRFRVRPLALDQQSRTPKVLVLPAVGAGALRLRRQQTMGASAPRELQGELAWPSTMEKRSEAGLAPGVCLWIRAWCMFLVSSTCSASAWRRRGLSVGEAADLLKRALLVLRRHFAFPCIPTLPSKGAQP